MHCREKADGAAPQGLEPRNPAPEAGVLPITPGRKAKGEGYRRAPVAGSGPIIDMSLDGSWILKLKGKESGKKWSGVA